MLIYIIGSKGSGKTLLLVYFALKSDKPIWSNFKIEVPNLKRIDSIVDLDKVGNNGLVCLDEIWSLIESRTSSADQNLFISDILFHSRKTFLDIIGTGIMYSSADKRFRTQCDILIIAKERFDQFKNDFSYTFIYRNGNIETFTIKYKDAKDFLFPKYNTYEVILNTRKAKIEFNILRQNPKKLYDKVKEIFKIIKNDLNGKITNNLIDYLLLKHGFYSGYKKYVYVYCKKKSGYI